MLLESDEEEPALQPLLDLIAKHPDLPRLTSQIAVFAVLENISWKAWLQYVRPEADSKSAPEPTPAEVVQAIDALGLLRLAYPERQFALSKDPDLRQRALRNPWTRTKAAGLYGLAVPGEAPGTAPKIDQLLHTRAGDNRPVCRLRQTPTGSVTDF